MTGQHSHVSQQQGSPKSEKLDASPEVIEVAAGVLRMQLPISLPGLGHVNCYCIEDERGIALVDPGLPGDESWNALEARLAAAGYKVADVHTAVVTHSHVDHFGNANRLRHVANAEILAHTDLRSIFPADEADENLEVDVDELSIEDLSDRWERPTPWGTIFERPPDDEFRRWVKMRQQQGDAFAVPEPSIRVTDTELVKLGRRDWIAVHTPGHTEDHLCLFDPTEGIMLSGDHVLPTITPHISGMAPEGGSLGRFFESLQRMHEFEVTTVLPAHGKVFSDLSGRSNEIVEHHLERLDQLRDMSDELGEATVTEFMQQLFRERSWGTMAESETFAHLEHLQRAGEALIGERDGLTTFRLTPNP